MNLIIYDNRKNFCHSVKTGTKLSRFRRNSLLLKIQYFIGINFGNNNY